ncbi:MAG: energy transducer TonB [Cytophagales bacterium]|nr:energy transducer TonB [Cytophagales bacterium]
MRKILFSLAFVLAAIFAQAQTTPYTDKDVKNDQSNDREAHPKGGINELYKYVFNNLTYCEEDIKNKVKGKVLLDIFVEKDSTISNIKVLETVGKECGPRLVELIKKQKFVPAVAYGIVIRHDVQIYVPVNAK